jgi:VWFA-related protein
MTHCLVLYVLLSALSATQQGPAAPQFRAEGLTVVVDVVVTEKNSRMVTDLTAADFAVYEDGVEQAIDTFRLSRRENAEVVRQPRPTGELQRPWESQATELRQPTPPNLIIFLLDYATTEFENQKLVQEAAVKYVQRSLGPSDLVAVFALGAAFRFLQDFTNDPDRLVAALQLRDASGRAMAATSRSAPQVSSSDSLALAESGSITVAAATPQGMSAAGGAARQQGSQAAQIMLAERIENLYYNMVSYVAQREARSVMRAIAAIARGVEHIEGRKTLVLFSQGFVVGPQLEYELERTVSVANRANLAVYGIDSQGLNPKPTSGDLLPRGQLDSISAAVGPRRKMASGGESLFDRAKQVGSDLRDTALRYISGATGGFAIRNTNDLHLGLERIDQDIHSYYVLSYRPKRQIFDGEFRSIRVEVKKPGLEVRARTGYQALPPGVDMVTAEEFRQLESARKGEIPLGLPVFLRLDWFHNKQGASTALAILEVPGSSIQFSPEVDPETKRHTARLEVVGLIRDSFGIVLERFGTPMNLHATPEELAALRQGSISFTNRLELTAGAYGCQVFIRDVLSGRAGLVEGGLQVPPSRPDQLVLSSIVLGKEVEKVAAPGAFLSVGDARLLPIAQRVFRNGEKLICFLEVYGAAGAEAGQGQVGVKLALQRGGSTERLQLPEFAVAASSAGGPILVARYVELSSLQPGAYFLSAQVTEVPAGRTAETRTSFVLTR